MKIFIDFDDVIFNTKEFGAEMRKFFQLNGVHEELIDKYYYASNCNEKYKLFDPWAMLDRIEQHESLSMKEVRTRFSNHLVDLSPFVFPDVEKFLKFVGRKNTYLISFGLPIFQNKKITASGVHKLVNGCVVTRSSKAEAIRGVMAQMKIDSAEQIIFIDDRIEQIGDIKKAFPDSITFFLSRKEGRYCDKKNKDCDYEISELQEAEKIISEL